MPPRAPVGGYQVSERFTLAAVVLPLIAFGAVVVLEHVVAAAIAPLTSWPAVALTDRTGNGSPGVAATSNRVDALER
jgi:hypothetical protein